MTGHDVQCVLRAGAINGEAPRWNAAEHKLYWVDMRAPALHAFDPLTGRDQCWNMPAWIGCFAFCDSGAILALRTGLFALNLATGELTQIAATPYDSRRFTFNDGRCDRQGRFLVGPMYNPLGCDHLPAETETAPVWRYAGEQGWAAVTPPVKISNGLAWSPDGRALYHSDTARKTIWAMDYDPATGEAENHRRFAQVEGGGDAGGPDGAAVDRDGFYTCALFGGGCLLRFDPDGRLERRIEVPPRYPTMPAFGAEDLATLYVTSASFPVPTEERAAHPDDGALFALEAPAPGLPTDFFRSHQQASAS